MTLTLRDQTAIVGIGQSEYGRSLPDSQLSLGAKALKAAPADAGLTRADVDGVAIHMGWLKGRDRRRAPLDCRTSGLRWACGSSWTSTT